MSRLIRIHSEAEAEILQALAWYEQRSGLAARAFVQELTHVLGWRAGRRTYGRAMLET